jgi:uncharacterized protein YecE (DUF72 family)
MIRVGTSGWNYPSGAGTWNGIFYPARRTRGFDELAYYAEHFDTVEINSTFYRMPEAAMSQRWIERTPPEFLFSLKLYQKFTHPDMYLARDGVKDWDLTRADIDLFRAGIEPLAAAGRLAALLLQFPASFHADPDTRLYLDWLLEAFAEFPLVVELRHRSWSATPDETLSQLAQRGASLAIVDAPTTSGVVSGQSGNDSRGLLYIRFHGRNAANWWTHEHRDDRYDYLYTPDELKPYAALASRSEKAAKRVLMYMNNHFSAKAVANAAILKHQLGQAVPGEYSREMRTRYPELRAITASTDLLE